MTAPRRAASARRSKAERPSAPPSAPSPEDGHARSPAGRPPAPLDQASSGDGSVFDGQYRIKLDAFEGPLDLLLHLIQQHELSILDIPVSFITEKYLEYLKLMQVLSIEIASEYLVMAATLVHIKSKMLLPVAPPGQDEGMPQEEEEDPRSELVRRLLEYQKYKAAAAELAERGTLGRDVFPRGVEEENSAAAVPAPFAKVEVFGLFEAFEQVLKRAKVKIDHEVVFDRISITDRIIELTDRLSGRRAVRFEWLFLAGSPGGAPTRFDLVITFLAMLEMARMKLLRVYQTGPLAPIYLGLVGETAELSDDDRAHADRDADATLSDSAGAESAAVEEEHMSQSVTGPGPDQEADETFAGIPDRTDQSPAAVLPDPAAEAPFADLLDPAGEAGAPLDRCDETFAEESAFDPELDRPTLPFMPPEDLELDRETPPVLPPADILSPGEARPDPIPAPETEIEDPPTSRDEGLDDD